jgi:hypothetical protein
VEEELQKLHKKYSQLVALYRKSLDNESTDITSRRSLDVPKSRGTGSGQATPRKQRAALSKSVVGLNSTIELNPKTLHTKQTTTTTKAVLLPSIFQKSNEVAKTRY